MRDAPTKRESATPTLAVPSHGPLAHARRRDQVGLERPAGTTERRHALHHPPAQLWPSVDDLAKTLRCEKPEWLGVPSIVEMLGPTGAIRLANGVETLGRNVESGKPDFGTSRVPARFPRFQRRGDRKLRRSLQRATLEIRLTC